MSIEGPDKVTISLFSKELGQDKHPIKYGDQLFAQKENIRIMAEKLSAAASKQDRNPPQIVVSILLIPDWKKANNAYNHPDYEQTKKEFFERVQQEFGDLNITIQDFYEEGNLTAADKAYLHQLEALGSNADMIKTRAIIDNSDARHLQIDSNTIIKDYEAFYNQTFGAPDGEQKDALNASYYDSAYVSAHNKVVYTTPTGKIAKTIEPAYTDYVLKHQDAAWDKTPSRNSIYGKIFAPALSKIGITYDNFDIADDWHFYPARLDAPEYRMTNNVVTAINMSWAGAGYGGGQQLNTDELKKIKPLAHQDAQYDFQSISYIIKKYTGYLHRNATGDENPHEFFERLLNISDNATDLKVLAEFYRHVMDTRPELAGSFAKVFPDTPKGNLLTQALFNSSDKDLHTNPMPVIRDLQQHDVQALKTSLIESDRITLTARTRRAPEYITETVFKSLMKKDLDVGTLVKNSNEAKVYSFISIIEKGGSPSSLSKAYNDLASLQPKETRDELIKQASRILKNGSDISGHFNHVPNRKTNLAALEFFIKDEARLKSQAPTQSQPRKMLVREFDDMRKSSEKLPRSKSTDDLSPKPPTEILSEHVTLKHTKK